MINEKIYEQTFQDLGLMLQSEQVKDLIKNNPSFQEYFVRDWALIWEYEIANPQNDSHSGAIFAELRELLGLATDGAEATPESLAKANQVNDQVALTNHKLLKQMLYKNLSITINDLKTNQASTYITPTEATAAGIESGTNNGNDSPGGGTEVVAAPSGGSQGVGGPQKESLLKEFFRKPDTNVYSYNTPEQLKNLSMEDKFFHARKTQQWCKQFRHQLFMIYLLPRKTKSKTKVVKAKFVKSFNDTYGTHFQVTNLDNEFSRLYNKYIDGKAYKDAIRVWIAVIGLPAMALILGLAIGLPLRSDHN